MSLPARTLVRGEWSASSSCRFTPGERTSGTFWIGGWVGPRTGLDDVEKRKFLTLSGLELWSLGRPARSQSLYRLRYPGFHIGLFDKLFVEDYSVRGYDAAQPCKQLLTFQRDLLLPFQGRRISLIRSLNLLFSSEDRRSKLLRNFGNDNIRLYCVTSQKRVIFILSAVRTSNVTIFFFNFVGWGETESNWYIGH
jgi:hypothetical protein